MSNNQSPDSGVTRYQIGRYSDDEQARLVATFRTAGIPTQLENKVLVVDSTYRRICDNIIHGLSPEIWGSQVAIAAARQGSIQGRVVASLPNGLQLSGRFATITDAVLIGGYSHGLISEQSYKIFFAEEGVVVIPLNTLGASYGSRYEELIVVNVDGPGAVTTGGRYIGGGFGPKGILEGIAVAAVLSTLTQRTSVHTYIEIQDKSSDMVFFTSTITPSELRVSLKPVWAKLRSTTSSPPRADDDVVERLEKLANLRSRGVVSDEEFEQLKRQILGGV